MSSTKNTGSSSKVVSYLKENKLLLKPRSEYPTTWSYVKGIIVLVNHWCHKILLTIAQIAVVIMLCTVFMNVVLRFCFNSGITWAEEVPRLLVTLFAFLACAIGVRDHMHISVTIIYNRFPKGSVARKIMDMLGDIATLICGIILFYYGLSFTLRMAALPGTLPMTGWSTWVQYFPAPMAGFLMIFDSLLFLFHIIDPNDLLYSEPEVDYQELVKQQAELATEGGNN